MKRLLCSAVIVFATVSAVPAQTATPWSSATDPRQQAAPAAPDQLLRQGLDRLTGFMMAGGAADPHRMRAFLDLQVAPYFDFDTMATWAAGGYYQRLSVEHRQALARQLRELFLGALARNRGAYAQPLPEVQVSAARAGRTPYEALVVARVLMPAGVSMRMEFRFYWNGSAWRIFDVAANGASAVAFYRDFYADRLRRYGPDVTFR